MSKSELYLSNIRHVDPDYYLEQDQCREWIRRAYKSRKIKNDPVEIENLDRFIDKYSVNSSKIKGRFSEISDFKNFDFSDNQIYFFHDDFLGAPLEKRMKYVSDCVTNKAKLLFSKDGKKPSHLIHVTCTGYDAPSPLQRLCELNGWRDTEITHSYHMGCYAALPSLRTAMGLSLLNNKIDIFHSELCTLHFSTDQLTPEQLIVQTLFADGYSAYSVTHSLPEGSHFKILGIKELRVPQSLTDMTWTPSHSNFSMSISRKVPRLLAKKILHGLETLISESNIQEDLDEVLKSAVFAVHPGGPKILEQVQKLLNIEDWQMESSFKILYEKGNMSSATLPHIWEDLLEKQWIEGQKVVSLAFGPGLTLFGSLMEYCE